MLKFITTQSVRVRTSEGEAQFCLPGTGTVLDSDPQFAGKWVTIPEGATVQLCAKFEKTDTFMLAVTTPAFTEEDGNKVPALMNGIVLRRKAFEKLVADGQAEVEEPEADDAGETTDNTENTEEAPVAKEA